MTRLSLCAMLIAALLLATGCKDDTKVKNAYVAATNSVVTSFEETFTSLQSGFTATSTPEQDQQTLQRIQASVDTAVTQLRAIKPPSQVALAHRRLVIAVQAYRPVIAAARKGFAASNPRAIIAARTRFSSSLGAVTQKITSQIDAINHELQS